MTLKGTQDLCSRKDDAFEKGVIAIFQWVAIFSTMGEWLIILLQELFKTFPKGVSKQNQDLLYLETCLSLSPDLVISDKTTSVRDYTADFPVLEISPNEVLSWLSECKRAVGIEEERPLPIVITVPKDAVVLYDIVIPTGEANGLMPKPQRVKPPAIPNPMARPAYVLNSNKKSQKRPPSTNKGGKGFG